jgi:hypothetical protein
MALVDRIADALKARRARALSRAAKACFCDKDGRLTREGEIVLADLRNLSQLFSSSVRRLPSAAIDKDYVLELEGRRQVVLRLLNLLELDPLGAAALREVEDHA